MHRPALRRREVTFEMASPGLAAAIYDGAGCFVARSGTHAYNERHAAEADQFYEGTHKVM
jgi:hypothetical protein